MIPRRPKQGKVTSCLGQMYYNLTLTNLQDESKLKLVIWQYQQKEGENFVLG